MFNLKAATFFLCTLFSTLAVAELTINNGDSLTITLRSQVIHKACTVDPTSVSRDIDFGQLRRVNLVDPGSASAWVPFGFTINNCLPPVAVTLTFNGTPADVNSALYMNTGTAENVEIEVQEAGGQNLGNGQHFTNTLTTQTSSSWNLRTRVISTNGGATGGTIKGVMTMTLSYE